MQPLTNHNNVLDLLIKEITGGTIKPGTRLVERKLSNKYGVSRTPVREALRKLEQMHIVKFEPYKGARVRQLQKNEANDIFELRILLESFSAKSCALKANVNDIKKLENTLKYFGDLIQQNSGDLELNKIFEINHLFHNLIAQGSHNHMLINIMASFQTHVALLRHLSLPQRPVVSLEEHTAIFNAIKNRKPEVAAQLAAEHIQMTWDFAIKYYNNH